MRAERVIFNQHRVKPRERSLARDSHFLFKVYMLISLLVIPSLTTRTN
jgi:hypothetical protein